MKKMSSLFVRELESEPAPGHKRPRYLAKPEYHEDATWVRDGEGVATRKWDGTACMVKDGILYRRRHRGWILVDPRDRDAKWHADLRSDAAALSDGTYELVGPKIQGNVEDFRNHTLVRHGAVEYPDAPREFEPLKKWLSKRNIEGLVFHRGNGDMIKIKKKDFGLCRKP